MSETDGLSQRELQIAQAYARGATYSVIADTLHIAPSTVRTHLSTIYRKLEVSSKLDLAARLQGDARATRSHSELTAVISELALSLEEAISREKALTEVLRIIGAARGAVDAVMPSILQYALDLCDAEFGVLFEARGPGRFHASYAQGIPATFEAWFDDQNEFQPGPATGLGRMAHQREVINIIDVRSEDLYRSNDPLRLATADLGGARSFLAIPMLAGDQLVGAFAIYRQTVRPFSDDATRLAQMFAAQSVIALENARILSVTMAGQP